MLRDGIGAYELQNGSRELSRVLGFAEVYSWHILVLTIVRSPHDNVR